MRYCWLEEHGVHERGEMPPCEGRLIRAHLLRQQVIVKNVRGCTSRSPLLWDERLWVWACGGRTGIGGHHGMFDGKAIKVARVKLPPELEEIALELELDWWLDKTYGRREVPCPPTA